MSRERQVESAPAGLWSLGSQDALTVSEEFMRTHLRDLRRHEAALLIQQERTIRTQMLVARNVEILNQAAYIRRVAEETNNVVE